MLGWLFVGVLGIIWVTFLLPYRRWWSSPAASVEEFERQMDLLAETNGRAPGRWVLIPRKGKRFHGPRDRTRIRVRRRRRQVLAFLVELTLLSLVIALFPPLHRMLVVPAVLGAALFLYVVALMRIRTIEVERDRIARARASRAASTGEPHSQPAPAAGAAGAATPTAADVHLLEEAGLRLLQDELRVTDEDVHVVVHRSDEISLEELREATGAR